MRPIHHVFALCAHDPLAGADAQPLNWNEWIYKIHWTILAP